MFSDELQDIIGSLLGQTCPDWPPPPRVAPTAATADQRHWIEVTRPRLGRALAEQPDLTARLSATIFKLVI